MSIFSISISYFFQIFSNIPIISKEIFIDFFKEQVFYFHVVESIGTFLHSPISLGEFSSPHVEKSLFTHVYCCFLRFIYLVIIIILTVAGLLLLPVGLLPL